MRRTDPDPTPQRPTADQAATYDRLVPMLEAAHHEMTELSKKKQDGVVNDLKIKMLNRLLTELGQVIENDPSYGFVDTLDDETAAAEQRRCPHPQPVEGSARSVSQAALRV